MVDMKKKLIVHVGTPKTGTSFLQSLCIANYSKLLDAGILYPGIESGHFVEKANISINASHILALFFTKDNKNAICDKLTIEIERVFNFNANTVLISDETLIAYNPHGYTNGYIFECLAFVCKKLNIDLSFIGYYREPSKYLPSHWAQIVRKHKRTTTLLEFVEKEYIPYWQNLINLHSSYQIVSIYSYDKELKSEGGLSASFFNALGVNINALTPLKQNKVNSSLSLNCLTAIRLLNGEFDENSIKEVEQILTKAKPSQVFMPPSLSPEAVIMVNERYESVMMQLKEITK